MRALESKAMRLEKIFGLSTFPVFRLSRYFEVLNKSGIWVRVSKVRKCRETYRKFSRKWLPKIISENVPVTKLLTENYTETNVIAENPG
jgi:hypothetical protein